MVRPRRDFGDQNVTEQLSLRVDEGAVVVHVADAEIARYVFRPDTPLYESPKPYLHPLRTLAGEEVTLLRPHDHVWHRGIQMTATSVSGSNFWGGATYVHGSGYVDLDNQGQMLHRSWEDVGVADGRAVLREALDWLDEDGDRMLEEHREIEFADVAPQSGRYRIRFRLALRNVTDRRLEFSSPTIAGRPDSGYGGLFWRGPRSFTGGQVFTSDGTTDAAAAMGSASPWLAFVGQHDGSGRFSTLVFVDHPENVRYPTKWFVRSQPFACVSFAFMFDEILALPAAEELRLTHDVIVADGALEAEDVARLVNHVPGRTDSEHVA